MNFERKCPDCGEEFNDVFQATDHLLEEGEEFDPALILPNGYKLMIGSLLRCMYRYAYEPDKIEEIVQSTYLTLFMAEMTAQGMSNLVADMIVNTTMGDIDEEYKKLIAGNEGV